MCFCKKSPPNSILLELGGFYSPYLNHFLQPDSIIPGASNPQNFNRYSYVQNNPVGFSDPSGHYMCEDDPCENPVSILAEYGVKSRGFNERERWAQVSAIRDIGRAFAKVTRDTPASAFRSGFAKGLSFVKSSQTCAEANPDHPEWDCWGVTHDTTITVYSNSDVSSVASYNNFLVHEMGHAFDNSFSESTILTTGYEGRVEDGANGSAIPTMPTGTDGYACVPKPGGLCDWVLGYHTAGTGYDFEQTADMFLGWTYGTWGPDKRRENWMDLWMTSLLKTGTAPSQSERDNCYEDSVDGCN
jgi:hypothetical protein